ncbi:unnamed protein product, partial [Cyprideis torosa]
ERGNGATMDAWEDGAVSAQEEVRVAPDERRGAEPREGLSSLNSSGQGEREGEEVVVEISTAVFPPDSARGGQEEEEW